jgi:pilus assembly protein CpaB
MNRSTRTFLVLAVAIGLASASTYLVYRAILSRPAREVEVAHAFAVVAAHQLTLGAQLKAGDVKVVPWPAANLVPGAFSNVDDVIDRGVIAPVSENEPLTPRNVATKESGAGLPPTIPPGMRAISVKVNEVIGVAGFVVPGTRVDVMVIMHQGQGSVARVVVSNVQVLAAGTKHDQEVAKTGEAMPSSVVTLMVSPDDAERVGLASSEGQILLTLRNPLDTATTPSTGINTSSLTSGITNGGTATAEVATPQPARPRRVAVAPPPPPPPAPKAYTVEVIRGAKRTEEIIK